MAKYEKLNWRMISKPGGATVKPDDFYSLYGCAAPFTSMSTPVEDTTAAVPTVELQLHAAALWTCTVIRRTGRSRGSDCVATLPARRLAQQVSEGDNKAERPMWAEKGGLDFEGRARWDAWTQRKGLAPDKAKAEFVKVTPSTVHFP